MFTFCLDMLLLAIRDPMGGEETRSGLSHHDSRDWGGVSTLGQRSDKVRKNRYH
jgi:hypothetical protein